MASYLVLLLSKKNLDLNESRRMISNSCHLHAQIKHFISINSNISLLEKWQTET